MSERLRGSGRRGNPVAHRDAFAPMAALLGNADMLLLGCKVAASNPQSARDAFVNAGRWWFWPGRERTLYTHTQSPNGSTPDCCDGAMTCSGMMTARALHTGGVNALMGDGSLRFVAQTIHREAWRALGTRDSGDLAD